MTNRQSNLVDLLREFAGPQYPDNICGKRAMSEAANEIVRLRLALERCMMGGNHIATHIDFLGPDWKAETEVGLNHYGAGPAYDAWCCWRAIMKAREMME